MTRRVTRASMDSETKALSESLIGEIFKALGRPEHGRARRAFGPLFSLATDRLSEIGMTFDRMCTKQGFPIAAEWALTNWCRDLAARGTELIPADGPLLVLSNHPGTYDMLMVASRLKRKDLRIFASDIPFLMGLPNASRYFIFLNLDAKERMTKTREAIRHLRDGGVVLLQGSGQIDPDPAVSEEAARNIDLWSHSVDLFLQFAPRTKVLLCIVSHAVSSGWARSPVTWLRHEPLDKRRLAEFGQVLQQLFFPGSLYLSPRLSFAPPVTLDELRTENPAGRLLPALIGREKRLLAEHLASFAK